VKGIVLAGGLGKRLLPLTRVTNKHLLPVGNQPMVYYPILKLVQAGVKDIMIVSGGNHAGEFLRLLGNGKEFGLKRLHYTYQEGEGGIAEALGLTEDFAEGDRIVVILGDNIFQDDIRPQVEIFLRQPAGARILLKAVEHPERFGVVELERGRIRRIVEKPKRPRSKLIVTGIYMYDSQVYGIIRGLRPSARNELEITDVNNAYLAQDALTYAVLRGWWTDAGTFESLHRANMLVRGKMTNVKCQMSNQ